MFCLVRTTSGEKRQDGISFLLIDMKTPGITVRPIITIDGGHEVNEVFLEDVRVPAKNLVGEQDKGWTIAKFLLGNERSGIAGVARRKKPLTVCVILRAASWKMVTRCCLRLISPGKLPNWKLT